MSLLSWLLFKVPVPFDGDVVSGLESTKNDPLRGSENYFVLGPRHDMSESTSSIFNIVAKGP